MILAKLISLIALAGYLALIMISLRQNGRRRVNRAFILYLAAMLFWQLSAVMVSFVGSSRAALLWYRLMTAGMGGQFIFYCLFVLVFTETKAKRPIFTAGWILFVALVASCFTDLIIKDVVLSHETGIYVPTFGLLVPFLEVIAFYYYAYGVLTLILASRGSKSLLQQNRIRYLLLGAAAIGIGAYSNLTHLQSFPIDVTANVISALIIAFAIGRHQLLDMSIVIRKGMRYSIPTVMIATFYFLLITLEINIFHSSGNTQIYVSMVLVVLTALIVQPLQNQAQTWVDRLFFREKYDSTQMLQRLSQSAASMLKLDSLTNMLLVEVTSTIHIEKAAFFLKNDKSGNYYLTAQIGLEKQGDFLFRNDHPIIVWLVNNKKVLTYAEIEQLPQFKALWEREKDQLERLDVELLVPVIAKKELVGVFTLGPKRSELQYSPDDVITLSTLANQTAVAIENARLFWQLEGTLEALRKTHDELEIRVQERTADLAIANEALKAENQEKLRAEEEIKRYTKDLERSNQELQQFAYVASHDLQEPLRMVSSFLQLLERRYGNQLDKDAKDFIYYAVDGAKRMQALINDLLEYSRVGTRGKPFAKINLNEVMQQAKSNLEIAIRENKAKISCNDLPMVYGDGTQLTQVFQNLIGNAIKFHGENVPEICIYAKRKNGTYDISVKDNGIGIDPKYTDRIFLIFQRLHNREDYPGTGIGLAICKRIIERHGGDMWVESKIGEGSTFHFSIPVKEKEAV
ncbi:MAG: ATP-binding protein [Anaerolineales bacterium]